MYYIIRYDLAENGAATLYRDPIPGRQVSFTCGKELGPLPLLTFRKRAGSKGRFLDYMGASPSCMVISDRFAALLGETGVDNAGFYPAQIVDETSGKTNSGYQAVNLELIACVDQQASDYVLMAGFPEDGPIPRSGVFQFKSLHLDHAKVRGARMFRLFEKSSIIVVHQTVKEAIENAGLEGMRMVSAKGFSSVS